MLADNRFLSVATLSLPADRCGGGLGPLHRIQQTSEKIQGWHSQCKHSEREGLRCGGNSIS